MKELSPLERCYFFQHYGIPTCFIDFTFDPIIALYFALTGVCGIRKQPNSHNYITIFQIDPQALQNNFNIKAITKSNFKYERFNQFLVGPAGYYIGLDLNPLLSCSSEINYNLKHQDACFIFYDTDPQKSINGEISLDSSLEVLAKIAGLSSCIVKFQINIDSIYASIPEPSVKHKSAFLYLENKKRTGNYLFNDIQGLKYDLNWLHQL